MFPAMSGDEMVERVAALVKENSDGLVAAYLFGSFGRGEATAASDVDLGLLYRTDPPRTLDAPPAQLQDRLERALGRPVDTVVLNAAPPELVHRVMRDGILLLDADPSLRIRFEVKARNEYFDLLPYLRLYRRSR